MRPEGLLLRLATWDDAQLLLDWTNDPDTRRNSFDPRPVEPEEHFAWFRARLADTDTRIYIGCSDGAPCGVVRFHRRTDDGAEVAVTVAPTFRGRRLAAPLLRVAQARFREDRPGTPVFARVKETNVASVRAFLRAGYRMTTTQDGVVRLVTD